jgi:hypothetical protein
MIYVNDVLADLKDLKTQAGQEYSEALKYFNKIGFPITFRVKKKILAKNETDEGHVFWSMPHYHIHHTATVNTDFGSEFWRYTPTPPHEKNGIVTFPTEGRYKAYSEKIVNFERNQADLLFFLWYKNNVFSKIYDIDDAKQVATDTVQRKMDEVALNAIFFSKDSILKNDEEKCATIARANNVSDVGAKTHDQRLVALESIIKKKVELKEITVKEFAESLQLDVLTELSANINEAYERKLILFDDGQNAFFYVSNKGEIGEKIVHVPIGRTETKFSFLRDYFKSDQRELNKFEEHIKNDSNPKLIIDIENLENLNWTKEILPYINAVGIKGTGANRKKDAVYADIRKTYVG